MTREELREHCKKEIENCEIWAAYKGQEPHGKVYEEHKLILELLEQEPSRDMEEIKEVINCDANAETKCKMISNILTAKLHYFKESFINKPCVSEKVCEHNKQMVLDKVRAEISALKSHHINNCYDDGFQGCRTNVLQIIDKYKGEITCQK